MNSAKETLTGHVGLEKLVLTSLQEISQKAKRFKKHRFQNLYRLLNQRTLMEAWKGINKKAAAGVDKKTAKEYARFLETNIEVIVDDLKKKKYRAKLVRRVDIPKGKGKTRPLGIPVISDKLVQKSVAMILEAIYEQDFLPNSYGYRPNVGPQKAVKDLSKELNFGKYSYIVEADIKGCFDHIDHDWLIKMLELRIDDKALIGLIKKWLKAGVLKPDGLVIHPATGTPQGGIISPILANIYLHHVHDLWFEKVVKPNCEGEAYLCRFADDLVCAFRYKRDAQRFYQTLGKRLNKFGLEVAEDKTKIISFSRFRKEENTAFDFLGFEFRWGVSRKGKDIIKRRTSRSKFRKALMSFKEWCKENRDKRLQELFKTLNAKLRGYYNYYGIIGNFESLNEFYEIAKKILYKWLNRRSQRRSFNWNEFVRTLSIYKIEQPRIVEKLIQELNQ
jgi:RNA-directed DNA polymerase